MKNTNSLAALLLPLALCLLPACSMRSGQPTPTPDVAASAPTPAEMQAVWKKAATPTAEHAFLKEFVGKWKATSSWRMAPDAKPEVSKATMTSTMVLGGKFLLQEYQGKAMGKDFRGTGFIGYDTLAGQFNSVWMDSMSTIMMSSSGSYDPKTKTLSLTGSMSCPLTKGPRAMRSVMRLIDRNHHSYEMYEPDFSGKEFKSLEIQYRRVK